MAIVVWSVPVGAQTIGELGATVAVQWPGAATATSTVSWPYREETATLVAEYERPVTPAVEVVGRVFPATDRRWRLGVGLAVTHVREHPRTTVVATVPHPILFDRPAIASTRAEDASRGVVGLHVEAAARTVVGPWTLVAFGGPSRLHLTRALVSAVHLEERLSLSAALPYTISIVSVDRQERATWAWGYNVGADVSVLLWRHLGVGGTVRYVRATGQLPDVLHETVDGRASTTDRQAMGGVFVGGGLRVRF